MERLVGARTIADLKKRILPAGLRDVQDWTDVILTFRRRDPDTGWDDIGTMPAISIRINANQPMEALGGVEITTRGTAKVWAADVDAIPLKVKDRFDWNGHSCVVDLVEPSRLDTHVTIGFTLLED